LILTISPTIGALNAPAVIGSRTVFEDFVTTALRNQWFGSVALAEEIAGAAIFWTPHIRASVPGAAQQSVAQDASHSLAR
jgi:hypothetical protein